MSVPHGMMGLRLREGLPEPHLTRQQDSWRDNGVVTKAATSVDDARRVKFWRVTLGFQNTCSGEVQILCCLSE